MKVEKMQEKMTLFVKEEIEIKVSDLQKDIDALKMLYKKQASQMDAISQVFSTLSNHAPPTNPRNLHPPFH